MEYKVDDLETHMEWGGSVEYSIEVATANDLIEGTSRFHVGNDHVAEFISKVLEVVDEVFALKTSQSEVLEGD